VKTWVGLKPRWVLAPILVELAVADPTCLVEEAVSQAAGRVQVVVLAAVDRIHNDKKD
jgi:hypothetical protein